MSVSEASDDGINEYALGHMPMPDFEALALDIQNRVSSRVGTVTMEIWNFREFFGMSVLVVKKLGVAREGLPEGGRPKHLLWALDFMKVYPKQSSGCLAVSASVGAVDLNTHRKWVWAFIYAVANLVDVVVSLTHTVGTGAGVTLCYHVWVIWMHDAGVDGDHGSRCGRKALI
jgi:hypothetical protein